VEVSSPHTPTRLKNTESETPTSTTTANNMSTTKYRRTSRQVSCMIVRISTGSSVVLLMPCGGGVCFDTPWINLFVVVCCVVWCPSTWAPLVSGLRCGGLFSSMIVRTSIRSSAKDPAAKRNQKLAEPKWKGTKQHSKPPQTSSYGPCPMSCVLWPMSYIYILCPTENDEPIVTSRS